MMRKKRAALPLKVAYLDLDGTLTHEGSLFHGVEGPTFAGALAIARLHEAGVEVVPVSGRKVPDLRETARMLGARNYIAELGSIVAYNRGKRVLHVAKRTVHELKDLGVADFLFKLYPGDLEWHAPWHEGREHTLLLRGNIPANEARDRLKAQYPNLTLIDNGPVRGGKHAYHVLEAGVGKRAAIALDRKERNLPKEACAAFGDSEGDREMAHEVGRFFRIGTDTRGKVGEGLLEAVEQVLEPPE